MLEESNGTGREDQEHAEDNILDEAALEAGNSGRVHKGEYAQIRPCLLFRNGRVLLERFLRGKND